jgi:hypothetical protein
MASLSGQRLRRTRQEELSRSASDVSTRCVCLFLPAISSLPSSPSFLRSNEFRICNVGQQHATSRNEANVAVFQLNESIRAILRELDVPVFECALCRPFHSPLVFLTNLSIRAGARIISGESHYSASSFSRFSCSFRHVLRSTLTFRFQPRSLPASHFPTDDDQHLKEGAPARLFGDMALFYLRRAVDGWDR